MGVGHRVLYKVKGQNTFVSESNHVAYQIKRKGALILLYKCIHLTIIYMYMEKGFSKIQPWYVRSVLN